MGWKKKEKNKRPKTDRESKRAQGPWPGPKSHMNQRRGQQALESQQGPPGSDGPFGPKLGFRLVHTWNGEESDRTTQQANARTLAFLKPKRSRFGCNTKTLNFFISPISLPLPLSHLPKLSQISLSKRKNTALCSSFAQKPVAVPPYTVVRRTTLHGGRWLPEPRISPHSPITTSLNL